MICYYMLVDFKLLVCLIAFVCLGFTTFIIVCNYTTSMLFSNCFIRKRRSNDVICRNELWEISIHCLETVRELICYSTNTHPYSFNVNGSFEKPLTHFGLNDFVILISNKTVIYIGTFNQ